MQKFIFPLLAFLLCPVASFAQLVLVLDKSSQQMDWLDGHSITMTNGFGGVQFGAPFNHIPVADATIVAPLLSYSGEGSHSSIAFEVSEDRTRIQSMVLVLSVPPLSSGITFSGTAAGPEKPTFTQGDFSLFANLTPGEYHLQPVDGAWTAGIDLVVVPEPATWMLLWTGLGTIAILRARCLSRSYAAEAHAMSPTSKNAG